MKIARCKGDEDEAREYSLINPNPNFSKTNPRAYSLINPRCRFSLTSSNKILIELGQALGR
jgi:hypothetical protein